VNQRVADLTVDAGDPQVGSSASPPRRPSGRARGN